MVRVLGLDVQSEGPWLRLEGEGPRDMRDEISRFRPARRGSYV